MSAVRLVFAVAISAAGLVSSASSQCSSIFRQPPTPAVETPRVPDGPPGAVTGHRGGILALTSWRFWWELNKERAAGRMGSRPT